MIKFDDKVNRVFELRIIALVHRHIKMKRADILKKLRTLTNNSTITTVYYYNKLKTCNRQYNTLKTLFIN